MYEEDQTKCNERGGGGAASSFASGFANGKRRTLSDVEHLFGNSTILESDDDESGLLRSRRLALKWHPFHPDIQKVRATCITSYLTHFIPLSPSTHLWYSFQKLFRLFISGGTVVPSPTHHAHAI